MFNFFATVNIFGVQLKIRARAQVNRHITYRLFFFCVFCNQSWNIKILADLSNIIRASHEKPFKWLADRGTNMAPVCEVWYRTRN
jgi:hypothetical protein